jgi:hypothetical protein
MLSIEKIRQKVDIKITDRELERLRDMIYNVCYGLLGKLK